MGPMTIAEVLPYVLLGTGTTLSLIVAIGAQNAYVLKQGIIGKFVWPIAIFCILSDVLLIGLGVLGFGALVDSAGWVLEILRWGGGAFLLTYGIMAARRALHPAAMTVQQSADSGPQTLGKALTLAAAMTYLNPPTPTWIPSSCWAVLPPSRGITAGISMRAPCWVVPSGSAL